MELDPDINVKEMENKSKFLKSGPVIMMTPVIQTTLFKFKGPEMWCREMVLGCVKTSVIKAMENIATQELTEEINACNQVFEGETEWTGPESKEEAAARKALGKAEKVLWKSLDDLDKIDQKADQKAKKAAEALTRRKAAETAKAAKLRVASENCKKITTFFQLQSKEQRPPKKDSHHASDWEMEDLDPNSALEMLWDDTPALTCKQVELLNNKRDRAMRIRLARRKKCEAVDKYKRKWVFRLL